MTQVPRDFTTLFDFSLHEVSMSNLPKVVRAFDTLGVKHETLSLITPEFETPLPPLQPAVGHTSPCTIATECV